ncbi:MAG: immunoglobulin domain-containing protein [Opitutales bacterium]|nr:immunoglobulin domain-containing protein [Opitutales bacterium]
MDSGDWAYYEVAVPAGAEGWRIVLESDSEELALGLSEGAEPTSTTTTVEFVGDTRSWTLTRTQTQVSEGSWYIGVRNTGDSAATFNLYSEEAPAVRELNWDNGYGDNAFVGTIGGFYHFTVSSQNTTYGAWRHALSLAEGKALLRTRRGAAPTTNSSIYDSGVVEDGAGIVMGLGTSGVNAQTWHLHVYVDPGADWSLTAGDIPITDLGELAADDSSSEGFVMPVEGVRYFRSTVPEDARAWQVWLKPDASSSGTMEREIHLRSNLAPAPATDSGNWDNFSAQYDVRGIGQDLYVPGEINPGGGDVYFLAVRGEPGESLFLSSRQRSAESLAFGLTTPLVDNEGSRFQVYRVDSQPVDILGWEVTVLQQSGDSFISARQNEVGNARRNVAFSEVEGADNSFTLVRPDLSDGPYYLTVYSQGAASYELMNRAPIVSNLDFNDTVINDDPDRAGWRYYQMNESEDQLAGLGWMLELADQVPGTRIAIRQNDLPGERSFRNGGNSQTLARITEENSNGFLQRPGHQNETWYIGIYMPDAALGEFELNSGEISVATLDADNVVDQSFTDLRPSEWVFYRFEIEETVNGHEVLGWELDVYNEANNMPRMVLQKASLPAETFASLANFGRGTSWGDGQRATARTDFTGRANPATSGFSEREIISVAMGQPLDAGTYYVGFRNTNSTDTADFSWNSRLIGYEGSGFGYEIKALDFADGSSGESFLNARGVSYYYVDIPEETPSWRVHLELLGEEDASSLYIRKDFLPNIFTRSESFLNPARPLASSYVIPPSSFMVQSDGHQVKQDRSGDQWFDFWVSRTSGILDAGRYYVMVVSSGQDPSANNRIGTGAIEYNLHSLGEIPVTHLGTVTEATLESIGQSYPTGGINYYTFDVDPGLNAVTLRLEGLDGNPYLRVREEHIAPSLLRRLPAGAGVANSYGQYSGRSFRYGDAQVIYLPDPDLEGYAIAVAAQTTSGGAGEYNLLVEPVIPSVANFDAFSDSVEDLPNNEWVYYEVTVPDNADLLGWEVRVDNWEGARPYIVIRRDALPDDTWINNAINMGGGTSWSSGGFAVTGAASVNTRDWSGRHASSTGSPYESYLLSFPLGQPLQPGSYYIGFTSVSTSATSFSWSTAAIGTEGSGYTHEVQSIDFDGESSSASGQLNPREIHYYAVEIPENTYRSWQLELRLAEPEQEARMFVRRGMLPNSQASSSAQANLNSTVAAPPQLQLDKTGDEHFVLWPASGQEFIAGGTYYMLVAGEGEEPDGTRIGEGPIDYELISHGEVEMEDLGLIAGGSQLTRSGSYGSGQQSYYQFELDAGIELLQLELSDRIGNPRMYLVEGALPSSVQTNYGLYSGRSAGWQDNERINVQDPAAGVYTLVITHASGFGDGFSEDSYTLSIRDDGPQTILNIDGFVAEDVFVQDSNDWAYYRVTVPEQIDGEELLGWEIRVTEWSGQEPPVVVVRRDQLPENASTTSGNVSIAGSATSWNSGQQIVMIPPSANHTWRDWTSRPFNADGTQQHEQILFSLPMGQPLQPGEYYIGFRPRGDTTNLTFSWSSRAIGSAGSGMSLEVAQIEFEDSVSGSLAPREVAYYTVEIEEETPSWEIELELPAGHEALLYIRGTYLPNSRTTSSSTADPSLWQGQSNINQAPQVRLDERINHRFVMWPRFGEDYLLPGTYYLMVVGQGIEPSDGNRIGEGEISYTLHSRGAVHPHSLGVMGNDTSIEDSRSYVAGQFVYYSFEVEEGTDSVELRLLDRVGSPRMAVVEGSLGARQLYLSGSNAIITHGHYSGQTQNVWRDDELITLPNPEPGEYTIAVSHGAAPNYGNGSFRLQASGKSAQPLLWGGGGDSWIGSLVQGQSDFFQVELTDQLEVIVEDVQTEMRDVIGWRLRALENDGSVEMRVRLDSLPFGSDTEGGQSRWSRGSLLVVPPYLESGDWFVEVRGIDSANDYQLISEPVFAESVEMSWTMPAKDEQTDDPELEDGIFADSAVLSGGASDGGRDLEVGNFHLYAIEVPEDNGGLLRASLRSLSGDPNLYIRKGALPTVAHGIPNNFGPGFGPVADFIQNRQAIAERAAWVPFDVRDSAALEPGTWYLKVHAAGTSTARYRMLLGHHAEPFVRGLDLAGGNLSNQQLDARHWRYYRVQMPEKLEDLPLEWEVSFTQHSGSVTMYVRDSAPPGVFGNDNPSSSQNLRDWQSDGMNPNGYHGFRSASNPGTYTMNGVGLVPGATYYLGFYADSDASFSVESDIGTETIESIYGAMALLNGTGGTLELELQPGEVRTWRIDFPVEAERWESVASNSSNIEFYLGQHRRLPYLLGDGNNFRSSDGGVDWVEDFNIPFGIRGFENIYYMSVVNTGDAPESFTFSVDWRDEDEDPVDPDPQDPAPGDPPVIVSQPASSGFVIGLSGVLEVEAMDADGGSLGYTWFLNGVELDGDRFVQDDEEGRLTILDVSASDAGDYTVTVSNSHGSVSSDPLSIEVYSAYQIGLLNEPSAYYDSGVENTFTLRIEADMVGTRDLENGFIAVYAVQSDGLLPDDRIGFIIRDQQGHEVQGSGLLEWPSDGNMSIARDGSFDLEFTLTFPEPEEYLIFLSLGDRIEVGGDVSTVTLLSGLLGDFLVLSADELRPEITTQPGPATQSVLHGSQLSFDVSATGLGDLEYRWFRNGNALTDWATDSKLLIPQVTKSSEGTYSVVVRNAFGEVESNGAVLLVVLPEALPDSFGDAEIEIIDLQTGSILYNSDWFGLFLAFENSQGWIYNEVSGWLYVWPGQVTGRMWFWDPIADFVFYTDEELHPFVYNEDIGFAVYSRGGDGRRYLIVLSSQQVLDLDLQP